MPVMCLTNALLPLDIFIIYYCSCNIVQVLISFFVVVRQHEKKFGVKSTYNSDLDEYTTKLSSSDSPEHQRKLAEATQLAAQIEGSAMSRANLALENGDQTEEEKFSAVIRPAPQHKSPVKRENLEQRSNK